MMDLIDSKEENPPGKGKRKSFISQVFRVHNHWQAQERRRFGFWSILLPGAKHRVRSLHRPPFTQTTTSIPSLVQDAHCARRVTACEEKSCYDEAGTKTPSFLNIWKEPYRQWLESTDRCFSWTLVCERHHASKSDSLACLPISCKASRSTCSPSSTPCERFRDLPCLNYRDWGLTLSKNDNLRIVGHILHLFACNQDLWPNMPAIPAMPGVIMSRSKRSSVGLIRGQRIHMVVLALKPVLMRLLSLMMRSRSLAIIWLWNFLAH